MEKLIEKEYYKSVSGLTQEILNNSRIWYEHIKQLPINQQIVYTIVLFNTQIENGGFHQYFFNSYGQFAHLALKYLKLIGSIKRAELLNKALIQINLEEKVFMELAFNRKLTGIVDFDKNLFAYLNELDSNYYDLEGEDIYELLEKYLEPSSFKLPNLNSF